MPTERRKCGKSGQVRLSGVGVDAIEGALDGVAGGSGAVAAHAEENHKHHHEADRGAHAQRHWMPNTFAAAYIFFAPPIAAQRRDVNVSIRITNTGAPIAPAI